jgi:hypothetical protein
MTTRKTERRLLDLVAQLPEAKAQALLEFAEFLVSRHGDTLETTAPLDIPRPDKETVVKAIKRLSATYPMLDRAKMLNETSVLVTQHVMHGRNAVEVIDELEILFRRHFETHSSSEE